MPLFLRSPRWQPVTSGIVGSQSDIAVQQTADDIDDDCDIEKFC